MNQIGGNHHSPHHSAHHPSHHHHHQLYQDATLVKHQRERFEEMQKCVNQNLSEPSPYDEAPQDLSRRFAPLPVRYPGYPPPPPPPPLEIKSEPPAVTVKTEPEDPDSYGLPLVTFPGLARSFSLDPPPPPPDRPRQHREENEAERTSSRTIIGSVQTIIGSVQTIISSVQTIIGSVQTILGSVKTIIGRVWTIMTFII